jgi:hypothetical protein
MAVKHLLGYSPTHLTLKGKVDSISAYGIELKQLNSSISNANHKREEAHASLKRYHSSRRKIPKLPLMLST